MTSKLVEQSFLLAEQAGFVFWEPGERVFEKIDWSSSYDEELIALVRLTVRTCWTISKDDRILEHFGLMKSRTL